MASKQLGTRCGDHPQLVHKLVLCLPHAEPLVAELLNHGDVRQYEERQRKLWYRPWHRPKIEGELHHLAEEMHLRLLDHHLKMFDMARIVVAVSFKIFSVQGSGPHPRANPGVQSLGDIRNGETWPAPGFPERS